MKHPENTTPNQLSFRERQAQKWASFKTNYPKLAKGAKLSLWLPVLGVVLVVLLFILTYFNVFGKVPTTQDLKNIQNNTASEIYSSDGVMLGKYYTENRINVGYEDISPYLVNALIATEDARFFEHSGIDGRAWLRVIGKTIMLSDESSGGGSTLSQQLAKNLYPRKKYKLFSVLINKIRETYVARRLEKVYTKNELISLYLNTVPFGGNIFGVEVASRQFFDVSAKKIAPESAAVLVGMLKANTYYHPVRHTDRAEKRRNVVLRQMEKYNYLTAIEADSLQAIPIKLNYHREGHHEGSATYFREHLRGELADLVKDIRRPDGTPYNIYTDGLKIYTTINSRLQNYAEEALTSHLAKLQKDFDKHWKGRKVWGDDMVILKEIEKSDRYKRLKKEGKSAAAIEAAFDTPVTMTIFGHGGAVKKEMSPRDSVAYYYSILNAGFLAMNPHNGEILAWVGGVDHQFFQYDHTQSRRQVGSTFKPIVYAGALRRGIPPCEYLDNRLVTYTDYEDWKPENSDGKYGGVYSMSGGLRNSVNSVAVNLMMQAGIDSVRQLAQSMGIGSDIPAVPAIALGAVEVSLYDMVQVYGTFANRGVKVPPVYLTRIETADGKVLYEADEKTRIPERILSSDHTDIMVSMMEGVVDSGTARRLRSTFKLNMPIAGKTGTTQSQADGWFIGFTPDFVAGVWVGGQSPKVRFRSLSLGQGANTALPIWGKFAQAAYNDNDFKKWRRSVFPVPSVSVLELLNCEDYLEELPEEEEEEFAIVEEIVDGVNAKIDRLLEKLKKKKEAERAAERATEKAEEKAERKEERTERKEKRKKKRKKFFEDLFGG